jgi:hypothetical protein
VAPLTLLELQRPLVRPLPAIAPDLCVWQRATVHRDCYVRLEHILHSNRQFTVAELVGVAGTSKVS